MSAVLGLKIAPDAQDSDAQDPPARTELSAAFRDAYAQHFQLVWRGLRRLGVPESLCEDAVQDVFLVVHRRWEDFEGRSQLKTWIYGISVRVAKDYRRAEERHSRRVRRYGELNRAEPVSVPPQDATERSEAHRILHRALAELPDEERAVFVLSELEELSIRDVAAALELHVRTCQRRLKRAREIFEAAARRHVVALQEPSG